MSTLAQQLRWLRGEELASPGTWDAVLGHIEHLEQALLKELRANPLLARPSDQGSATGRGGAG